MNDVDTYIAKAPEEVQEKLKQLRSLIAEIAPEAKESINYGMPYYDYKGRLAYFAIAKKHIGLYIPPPIIGDHKNELKKYKTSKSAIQFPLSEDLPVALIHKIVKARMKWNEEQKKK